jgi:hypothetical protein
MMTTLLRRAGRYITTCAGVATSGFNEVTDFGILPLQPVGLVPGDDYQLVIHDSVDDGMRFGYRDRFCRSLCNDGQF